MPECAGNQSTSENNPKLSKLPMRECLARIACQGSPQFCVTGMELALCCGCRGLPGGPCRGVQQPLPGSLRAFLQATFLKISLICVMPENSFETNGL